MKINIKETLFVIALSEEFNNENYIKKNNLNFIYTGVGKVNASISLLNTFLSKENDINKIKNIVNFGSVGSKDYKVGDLVNPLTFYQNDMSCEVFGYKRFQTPQEKIIELSFNEILTNLDHPICLTSDKFITNMSQDNDFINKKIIYDMEGYSLAKVCKKLNKNFISIKYITDDGKHNDQNKNVKNCTECFIEYIKKNFK